MVLYILGLVILTFIIIMKVNITIVLTVSYRFKLLSITLALFSSSLFLHFNIKSIAFFNIHCNYVPVLASYLIFE